MLYVNMSEWLFKQAFTCGMFWLNRHGDWYLIHLNCFEVEEVDFTKGWHHLRLTLKDGDHWGRLVYGRILHGRTGNVATRPHRPASLVVL